RQAEAIAPRNKRRNRSAQADCPLPARQPPFPHNRAERRRQARAAETSTRLAPFRCRQKHSSRVRAGAKSAALCPIHPATIAPPLCAAAKWIAKWKALLRAVQRACRCCPAKLSDRRRVIPSESAGSGRWDASLLRLAFSFRA